MSVNPLSHLEVALLDVGGTLLREQPPRARVYLEAALERGLQVENRDMRHLMYRTAQSLPRSLAGHFHYSEGWFRAFIERIYVGQLGLEPRELPGLQAELLAWFRAPEHFVPFPGALELLERLRDGGLTVGIVSNWSEALPGILEGLGIAARVDFVLTSAIEGCEKPGPELFRRALARAGGAQAARAVYAGNDLVLDVQGARDAGILPVLVEHVDYAGRAKDVPEGVARVTSLPELGDWILERSA